ncbi:hypothetical protein BO83DRAFT_400969 [Aspergillus eucalypticola CBS 122712]|uniref:Uncharacterized protein n=1 Tax=Aspergillus eucalypticola (strain CBS 122712 / IBT 29274) TaxID=1448314 RepID=A0A317V4R4_ASPEC|nr:uncharacterized protein BO83DRAFT_400969 [Aspergillus eucalypticola CBS 122712]PWY67837.1 hypothetical protein BO83DRAFT_400969 [Aspergillus eucalypticola CBS 122712]
MPFSKKPAFDDLPLDKTGPPGNAWGLSGPNDQCVMLNLLTPDRTCAAVSEIRDGIRISTDWPLDRITTPAFNRVPFTQTISNIAPTSVNDDILHFNTQSSSQWDGLRHFGYQEQRLYFNGRTLDEILTTKRRNRWSGGQPCPCEAFHDPVNHSRRPGESGPGPEHRVETGLGMGLCRIISKEISAMADISTPPAIGIESSEATLRWLWEKEFAAVASDTPSFEAWPCQDCKYWLHEWLLAVSKRQRWSFFFTNVPLKVSYTADCDPFIPDLLIIRFLD